MKRIFFVVAILISTLSLFGQQYHIGASIGWHKDIFTLSETNRYVSNDKSYLYNPSANLNFSFLFKNNIELSLGLGYYQYRFNRFLYLLDKKNKEIGMGTSYGMFDVLTIPIAVGYGINLWKNRLLFKVQSGLDFDIYFLSEWNGGGCQGEIAVDIVSYSTKIPFNILLSNRIVLQYYTKFNMSIAIFGAYHAGLRKTWENASAHFEWKNENDPAWLFEDDHYHHLIWGQGREILDTKLLSNGSYWQFGIELGYKFGKKKTKEQKE